MEKNTKSKITVLGFVTFVLLIYTASYFYTKNNNERLLSAPRLVLLIGSQEQINQEFSQMPAEKRRQEIRTLYSLGRIFSISQERYDNGERDIEKIFDQQIGDEIFIVEDCLFYSEKLKQTMVAVDKAKMKRTWVFSACGIID